MTDKKPIDPKDRESPAGLSLFGKLKRIRWETRRSSREEKEALDVPRMSRRAQAFAMMAFFALGGTVVWFVVANPLEVPFLPQPPSGEARATPPHSERLNGPLYRCPMHSEVVEDHPGVCPICGMTLIEVTGTGGASTGKPPVSSSGERQVLYWYAPMDPTYIRDEPGVSPMGMKLVPKYADAAGESGDGIIHIDPVQVQNTGVVSTEAKLDDITRSSRTVGILDFNADRVVWVNTKFEGWIEKVHVNYVGQDVRRKQPLFEIYSPKLVTTQEEYLRALDYRASLAESNRPQTLRQADSLVQATRERLAYWDIEDEQIKSLEASRDVQRLLTVTSPADGIVADVMSEALDGMYVKPGMDLYKIADLSTVWLHAEVFEVDIPWIRRGQSALVSFPNDPGAEFEGKVLFIYPQVAQDTRALKVCVELPNPGRRLRPGMYADIVLQGPLVSNAVVIPQSAVIRSGERNVVFLDLGAGKFEPREVTLGVKAEGDRIEIVEGVAPGQRVVTQGQFMLDSESRLQEAIAQYRERGKSASQEAGDPSPSSRPD